ncbi:MAG: hypothetical protein HND48_14400 [Chloroflexi bacterium]|nr:hypothetical protein [Chloroflexota bacterium]
MTSWVVIALAEAQDNGFTVLPAAISSGGRFLSDSLRVDQSQHAVVPLEPSCASAVCAVAQRRSFAGNARVWSVSICATGWMCTAAPCCCAQ